MTFTGASIKQMTAGKEIELNSCKDCLQMLICAEPTEKCYFGDCENCSGTDNLKRYLTEIFQEKDIDKIRFNQWVGNPISFETLVQDNERFIDHFCEKLTDLLLHSFIADQQLKFARFLQDNLKLGEFLTIEDFAENYTCRVQNSASGYHWNNNNQVTLFNVVIYYRDVDGIMKHINLVFVSDCSTHDSVAVYIFLKKINQFLKEKFTRVDKIYYFSDEAPQQFENFKHVFNSMEHQKKFAVSVKWHFHPTVHGKGPSDGLGATVKQAAIKYSLQAGTDNRITNSQELHEWLSTTSRIPNIEFRYSSQKDYDASQRHLNARLKNNKRVDHIKEQHCFIPLQNGVIRVKKYSAPSEYTENKIC